ncbi:MAG: T9SS type A sorting domain-containing protein [Bacteroidia bacterium]|nr:T9SS type A sorting domain-containing protein [Bacteroidia bacterium]
MKHYSRMHTVLLIALVSIGSYLKSQVYSATWVKGSAVLDQLSVYGNPGTPANANTPGARDGAASWTDASGNFWLMGGLGFDYSNSYAILNDLWKYNPATNQWTFMKGDSLGGVFGVYGTQTTPAATNKPGSRGYSTTWTDASGNLWLFGGIGYDGSFGIGEMNDLWKYNISTNQWTWMGGSNVNSDGGTYGTQGTGSTSNIPGARYSLSSWTDASGNFWLFGGTGYSGTNYGDLQDLWKYNPSTGQWTWVKGSANIDVNGVYGTMGTAASSNLPGSRIMPSTWSDASGDLWMFGGQGYDASSGYDLLNDLWKYNISTNQWTWISGSNSAAQPGTYGTMNVPSALNIPGARGGSANWVDASGNFYLFGGFAYDAMSGNDNINDLWKYSPSTNQWTWLKGSNLVGQNGAYGIQGVPSVNNHPGARNVPTYWSDANSNLWLFGGAGMDSSSVLTGDLNDLWKMETCVAPTITALPSTTNVCAGNSVTITAGGASTYSWSSGQTTSTINMTPTGSVNVVLSGTTSTGCSNSMIYMQTVAPSTTIAITASSPTGCALTAITVTASGAPNYSWSTGATGSVASINSGLPGTFTITSYPVGNTGCVTQGTTTLQFYPNPTVTAVSSKTLICKGASAVLTATGATSYTWNVTPAVINQTISVNPNTITTYSVTGTDANGCTGSYALVQNVQDCTGFEDLVKQSQISLYPNPSDGSFKISTNDLPENSKLIIFNSLGQQVLVQTLENGENTVELKSQSGIYIYRIVNSQQELRTGKIVIK